MAHILIVDDEEIERLLGRTALEGAGHQLLFAPNGEAALRAYQNNDIDLVITDLTMPGMNGMLLIEQIMAENNHALIIAVSGVSVIGRNTQGVRCISLKGDDKLVSVARIPKEDPEDEVESAGEVAGDAAPESDNKPEGE